jgi:hypothetical protein
MDGCSMAMVCDTTQASSILECMQGICLGEKIAMPLYGTSL